ncbi:hypothetical protein [uncultured Rothia sp.]|uniref:hypothetical protein n=1 Tax=uncultured Rothia sp. TaxID=316088 RepID=UPI0032170302
MNLPKSLGGIVLSAVFIISMSACGTTEPSSSASSLSEAKALKITDITGRTVEFDEAPERIVLGEGRALFATSILNHEKPFNNVVAMGNDLKKVPPPSTTN